MKKENEAMKKNHMIRWIALSMVCILSAGFTACGQTTAPASSSVAAEASATAAKESSSAAAESAPAEKANAVTLKMIEHSNQGTNDAVKGLNTAFMSKYPNIKVESTIIGTEQYAQMMQTRIAAADVDIFELTCFNIVNPEWAKGLDTNATVQYIENGDVLDLTGQPFVQNWDPSAIADANTYKGKVYSLNIGKVAMNGVYYNKTMFEQNGIQVPSTWSEFTALCKKLQAAGISPMTGGGKDGWPIGMMWNGFVNTFEPDPAGFNKALWSGERKFNDEKTLALFDKMAEFASYYEKGVTAVDYASVIGRFVAGKAAMMPDGTWQGAQITTADPNFKFGYFCIPGDTAGAKPVQLAGKYDIGYAGYAKTKNADAVLQWLDFLSQKDVYTEFVNANGFIPTMQGITMNNAFINSLAPINESFQRNYENLGRSPKGIGKYGGFAISELQMLGGSVATTKELADLAQKDWDTAIAAIK